MEKFSAVFDKRGDPYGFYKRRIGYKRRVIHWLLDGGFWPINNLLAMGTLDKFTLFSNKNTYYSCSSFSPNFPNFPKFFIFLKPQNSLHLLYPGIPWSRPRWIFRDIKSCPGGSVFKNNLLRKLSTIKLK